MTATQPQQSNNGPVATQYPGAPACKTSSSAFQRAAGWTQTPRPLASETCRYCGIREGREAFFHSWGGLVGLGLIRKM
ncbi:predicted protein [Plenodomus lingam JN3]|uniref:Predicted protein n=1 Tax=Leptosphaeria maculans (strain JN3 / isolate v23.1.3 / race Av1-4-5-6-7-8) TaxID=985895 RepID=E5ABA1_LEPMJ|nr:predicted protein [Plenodomus lingam JN3]CBY00942.1 predicted protein [Plenodomus lingam JN3]